MNKKYFSKALCYADRSQYYSILIINSLYLILTSLILFTDGPKAVPRLLEVSIMSTPILVINAIIIFFSYSGKRVKQFYMTTQPYSRDAMIITKLICFSLSCIIPLIIYGVTVSLLYLTGTKGFTDVINSAVHSPMILLWRNTVIISASFISMVIAIQFIQVLFGKCRYALLIPFAFSMFIIPITCTIIFIFFTGASPSGANFLADIIRSFLDRFVYFGDFILDNPGWSFLIDLIHIAIFAPLTIFLNRKVKSEKTGDMFLFKPIEVICKILLAIFIGFCAISIISVIIFIIVAKISSSSIDIDVPDKVFSVVCYLVLIAGSVLSVVSYKIINRIQSRRA